MGTARPTAPGIRNDPRAPPRSAPVALETLIQISVATEPFDATGKVVRRLGAEHPQTSLDGVRCTADDLRVGATDGAFNLRQQPRRFSQKNPDNFGKQFQVSIDDLQSFAED